MTESALALGRDLLKGMMLIAAIKTFDKLNPDIPTELIPEIFVMSMRLTDDNGAPVYWDARAMWLAYRKYLKEREGRQDRGRPSRLALAASSAVECPRCDFWGVVPGGCDHPPLTKAETEEITRERAKEAEKLREFLAGITGPKPFPAVSVADEISVTYTCNECGRAGRSDFGWSYNDDCGVRLPGPVREGERHGCPGHMQVL